MTGNNPSQLKIYALDSKYKNWIEQIIAERWGENKVVVHRTIYTPSELPGFIAIEGNKKQGLLTYHIKDNQCEIVTIDSLSPSKGIGTALITAVKKMAKKARYHRLWLITTNDNLNALRFYQKLGFSLVKINKNALEISRQLKPNIPEIGFEGIPLRDEIELEMLIN